MESNTKVAIRIRPHLSTEINDKKWLHYINKNPRSLFIQDKNKNYSFDRVFTEDVDQLQVFEAMVKPLINKVCSGINCTVFAYGHTGTGKSYTMGTDKMFNEKENMGIIPRAIREILTHSEENRIKIQISYYEIYNKKVYDLLNKNNMLQVKGFQIKNLLHIDVKNAEAVNHINSGNKNRHISRTELNSTSSRSHAVFVILCKIKQSDGTEITAKLNLVDLAGSESAKKTGNQGSQFQEGVNINQGLLAVGQVINALSQNSYIPYRDSMITTVLQDSLNTKTFITLIACVSSHSEHVNETIQTLDFARNVKKVKNDYKVNNITEYKRQNSTILEDTTNIRYKSKVSQTPLKKPSFSKFVTSTVQRPAQNINCYTPTINTTNVNISVIENITKMFSNQNTKLEQIEQNIDILKQSMKNIDKKNLRLEISNIIHIELEQYRLTPKPELKTKILEKCINLYDSCNDMDATVMENNEVQNLEKVNLSPIFKIPKMQKQIFTSKQSLQRTHDNSILRRSVRIAEKSMRISEKSIAISPRKINKSKKSSNRSKIKSNYSKVDKKNALDILNNGTEKDLQQFITIGPKTAKQICIFRKSNGKFSKINDLSQMPWRGNGYENFLKYNLLK